MTYTFVFNTQCSYRYFKNKSRHFTQPSYSFTKGILKPQSTGALTMSHYMLIPSNIWCMHSCFTAHTLSQHYLNTLNVLARIGYLLALPPNFSHRKRMETQTFDWKRQNIQQVYKHVPKKSWNFRFTFNHAFVITFSLTCHSEAYVHVTLWKLNRQFVYQC